MELPNKKVLELLGFTDEEGFQAAKQIVGNPSASREEFKSSVTFPLLVAVRDLLSNQPTKGSSMLEARLDPETLAETKRIVRDNFSTLPDHPLFDQILQEGIQQQWKPDGLADVNIHSVSVTPLLVGFGPPHAALLNLDLQDRDEKTIFSEKCHWADVVFLMSALAKGVADHSSDLAKKVQTGECASPPIKVVKDWIAETREALDRIDASFHDPE